MMLLMNKTDINIMSKSFLTKNLKIIDICKEGIKFDIL